MKTTQTVKDARGLQAMLYGAGHEVTLRDAWRMVRLVPMVAERVKDDQARAARNDRVRRGMVANAIADLRAVGAWDGE